jgi:mRNA interferase MazF
MRYQFGDVVLVPFPFTDQSTTKQRPGVIVLSAAYHDARRDLILMAVTSQVRGAGVFGELVVQDWQAAKLLKPSAVKPVLATLEQTLVIKTLGRLSAPDQQRLRESIATALRVTPPRRFFILAASCSWVRFGPRSKREAILPRSKNDTDTRERGALCARAARASTDAAPAAPYRVRDSAP